MSCALAILAGGKGERLGGIAKGLLRHGGRTLIEQQLSLGDLFDDVLLVTDDPGPYAALGVRTTPDLIPGRGAPGGLHAALAAARAEWVLVIACDMPFVTRAAVELFLDRRSGAVDVVASEKDGRLEPLPSVWRTALCPKLALRLASGPSLRSLCAAFRLERVLPEALIRVDPALRTSVSINRPEDLLAHTVGLPAAGDLSGS